MDSRIIQLTTTSMLKPDPRGMGGEMKRMHAHMEVLFTEGTRSIRCLPLILLLGGPRPKQAPEPPLESPEEALRLASEIPELTARVRRVPGLEEGKVEEVEREQDRILREYSEMNPRRPTRFIRDLSDLATKIDNAHKEGVLSDKQTKILELMIKKTKIRDFYSARKLLIKFTKPLELKKERDGKLERYRTYFRKLDGRAKELKSQISQMKSVPKPEKSPEEIEAARKVVEEYNEAAAGALVDFFAHAPCVDAIRYALEASSVHELNIPAPKSRESVKEFIRALQEEHVKGAFGKENLAKLVEVSGYSEKRLEHFVTDYKWLQRQLHENVNWLSELTASRSHAMGVAWLDSPERIRARVTVIEPYLSRLPRSERAIHLMEALLKMIESGEYEACVRNEAIYRTQGEAAAARFRGTLDEDIRILESELGEVQRHLTRLPGPEKLIA